MIFADNPHDREIEKMMQKTPHFRPRGHGIFVNEKTEYNAERCGCRECVDRKKKRRVSGEKTPTTHSTEKEKLCAFLCQKLKTE